MRKIIISFALLLIATNPSFAHEARGGHHAAVRDVHSSNHPSIHYNAKLLIGMKDLPDERWNEYDTQFVFGLDFDHRGPGWPANLFLSISLSTTGSQDMSGTGRYGFMRELDFGFRKYFSDTAAISPYFSVGAAMVNVGIADREQWYQDERHGGRWEDHTRYYDDFTYGIFLNMGYDFRVNHGRVGLDIRGVVGTPDAQIDGPGGIVQGRGDYIQVGITWGIGNH